MGGMDLRKLPLPPPPPYPLQPSPARPRGRWGLGGQDVRAKAGGRWEGELKAQRPFTTTGRGLTAPAGAVLAAATTPQLLGMGGGGGTAGLGVLLRLCCKQRAQCTWKLGLEGEEEATFTWEKIWE